MITYNTHTNLLAATAPPPATSVSWPQDNGAIRYEENGARPSRANPPFEGSTASKRNPLASISAPNTSSLIQRGYIRRTYTKSDPTSRYLLNFMFNPTTIQRNYVSYLEQNAVDPYNTVFQAGNLVAPPGMLDFSFDLLYDRQLEVTKNPDHRGCLVDYDYFDRVIRAVEPGDNSPSTPPDSGILLVNPRDVTVMFGPKLIVVGRVNTANVVFERFSHKMIPTRMRITLGMKVYSFGETTEVLDFFNTNVVANHKAVVTYEKITGSKLKYALTDYDAESDEEGIRQLAQEQQYTDGSTPAGGDTGTGGGWWGERREAASGPAHLVEWNGTKMSARFYARWKPLADAAKRDGITLSGNAWRSSDQQIALRKKNCPDWRNSRANACSPPTAKPGTSRHEVGDAIDLSFGNNRNAPEFQWLVRNAGRFGVYNLPSEPWHWSIDGG